MGTNFLKNTAISKLLIGVYALLVVVLIVVIVVLIRDSNTVMKQYDDIAKHSTQKLALMGEIRKGTAYVQVAVLREAIFTAQADMDKEEKTIQHESERVQNKLDNYEKLIEEPAERKMFNDVIAARSENAKARNVLKELSTTKKQKAIESQTKYQWILFERYQDALSNLSGYIAKQTIEKGNAADLFTQRAIRRITYEVGAAILLLIILGFLIVRTSGKIKENEKNLNEQINFAEGLLQAAPDGMIGINPKGEIILFNRQAEVLFGYERGEITGKRIENLMPQRFKQAHETHIKGYFEAPKVRQMGGSNRDLFGRRKNGEEFPIDISLSYMQQADGKIAIAGIRDITERKQIEKKLTESEARIRSTLDAMIEGVQIIGFEWKCLYINDAAAKQGRISKEETMGHIMMEIFPGIESTEMFKSFQQCMKERIAHHIVSEYRFPDGSIGYFELNIEPVPEGISILSIDVTEKKKGEDNLKQSAARLNKAQEITHLGSWELNFATGVGIWSDETCKIYGLSLEENKQSYDSWVSFILPDDKDFVLKKVKEAQDSLSHSSFSHRIVRKDGTIRYVYSESLFELNKEGKPIGLYGIVHDVTESKLAEEKLIHYNEELQKTNRELDQFVYSVSHDLRAPLSSMLGIIELSQDDTTDEVMLENLKMLEGNVKRLDEFIVDILEYSRNARLEVKKEEINFKALLHDITSNLKYMGGNNRKVDIKIDVTDKVSVHSDKIRLNMILNNLISNAIRYQNPHIQNPFVNIKVETSGAETGIIISDNGIGISKENQPKIFDMFYRISDKSVGSGLGLYIVKETVKKLNGSIHVESEPGKGSTFIVKIPNLN